MTEAIRGSAQNLVQVIIFLLCPGLASNPWSTRIAASLVLLPVSFTQAFPGNVIRTAWDRAWLMGNINSFAADEWIAISNQTAVVHRTQTRGFGSTWYVRWFFAIKYSAWIDHV